MERGIVRNRFPLTQRRRAHLVGYAGGILLTVVVVVLFLMKGTEGCRNLGWTRGALYLFEVLGSTQKNLP